MQLVVAVEDGITHVALPEETVPELVAQEQLELVRVQLLIEAVAAAAEQRLVEMAVPVDLVL
jgi:hypothetical protein